MAERRRRTPARHASTAADRLRRLLTVVPFVIAHPGVQVADLAERFGVSQRELLDDLNMLFISGLPPYGPGDLIDVDVDEEGGVRISMADYLSRPVRLTISEALALYLRGKALLGTPGMEEAPAMASALAKLEGGLDPQVLGALAERVSVDGGGAPAEALAALRRAVRERRTMRIRYYSAGRDSLSSREIDPEHVFTAIGNWYVVAWDRGADAERLFRVDRVETAVETGATFTPRGLAGAGRPLYTRSKDDVPVRLALGPGAGWVAEYYETHDRRRRPDGRLEVTLPTKALPWVAKLVLRLGGEATVIAPPELAEMVRAAAGEALAGYRPAR